MKFLILNGPNVNLQRYSEPGMPGELDYNGMMDYVQSGCDQMGIETDVCQTNHEGDLIDEILRQAARSGKALEINTSGLRQPLGETLPTLPYVRRFREFGGEYVTVGSDAHYAEDLGKGVNEGMKVAQEAGFSHVTLFQGRTPLPIPIE